VGQSIAVITDVHGNVPALEAALARIDELGIGKVYCGGDLVGYGPWPNEVCRLLEARGIPTIYGNYDYAIGRDQEDCGCAYTDTHDRELGERSIAWTLEHTDAASKAFMRGLPFDLRFELGGRRARLVHGSPRKVNEYLFEDKPAKTFERIARGADCDVLVCCHTTNRGFTNTPGFCSSTAARLESPRTAIPEEVSRCSRRPARRYALGSTASATTSITWPSGWPARACRLSTERSC
jgi:predicted phosphodiesterase